MSSWENRRGRRWCRREAPPAAERHARGRVRGRARSTLATAASAASVGVLCGLPCPAASAAETGGPQGAAGGEGSLVSGGSRHWSAPVVLARCDFAGDPQLGGPRVAFPSESPSTPTGLGAIAWASAPNACEPGSARPDRWAVSVAALGSDDRARLTGTPSFDGRAGTELSAVGATLGRIALVAANVGAASAGSAAAVLQGRAADAARWASVTLGSNAPPALARAYLGDVAIASVRPGPAIAVSVERHFQSEFGAPRLVPIAAGPVTALTATMDYRADVLLAWQQNGAIYAHMLRQSGRRDSTQRVGPSGPDPQIQAVVSDNDHGMIAWSSTDSPGRSTAGTRIYLALSAAGVRFGQPRRLASFADPQRVGATPGSLALERLSTENVMLAWTLAEHGHYVVRAAPAVFAASRPTTRLSDPNSQSILAALAPGPAAEAIALWRTAPPLGDGALDMRRAELWTARTAIRPHAHVVLRAPERIAAAGPYLAPTVAVDPSNDRPVAAWLTATEPARVEYAVGVGAPGYRPSAQAAIAGPPGTETHWLRITLAAAGLAAAMLLAAASLRRRRQRAS